MYTDSEGVEFHGSGGRVESETLVEGQESVVAERGGVGGVLSLVWGACLLVVDTSQSVAHVIHR